MRNQAADSRDAIALIADWTTSCWSKGLLAVALGQVIE
jgi:hypothetical protein